MLVLHPDDMQGTVRAETQWWVGRVGMNNVMEIVNMIVYVEATVIFYKPYCLGIGDCKGGDILLEVLKIFFMCLAYMNCLLFSVWIGIYFIKIWINVNN